MDRHRGIAQKVDANSILAHRRSPIDLSWYVNAPPHSMLELTFVSSIRPPVSTHVDLETWIVTGDWTSLSTMFASRQTVRWYSHIDYDYSG